MAIKNPIFSIPATYKREEQKPGGKSAPPYLGDMGKFEQHKRQIVDSLDTIINYSQKIKPKVSNPDQLNFFEIQFHDKAISKSAQPTELLDRNNIQILSQIDDKSFVVSVKDDSLAQFRDSTSRFSLNDNKKESALLSAITEVRSITKEERFPQEEFPDDTSYPAYIFLYDSFSEAGSKKINEEIKKQSKSETEFFVTESGAKTIFGNFRKSFLDEISDPHPQNPIQRIEKSLYFVVQQAAPVLYDLKKIKVVDPEIDAKVGVVDSGITNHFLYKNLLIGVEDFVKDPNQTDLAHGTFVGSRVIFGETIEDQIFNSGTLFAQSKILDIRVMRVTTMPDGTKQCGVDDKDLVDAIKAVVKKHGSDVKVYNLSLNNGDYNCTHSCKRHFISRELDSIAYKYKVIFVVSAGNNSDCMSQAYPDCFSLRENVITPPADLINGLVVGSVADNESSRSIALNNEPSPFTRVGLLGTKKPDLVHFGGNLTKYGRPDGLGVKGLSPDQNGLTEDIGTSYSAPIVSQITAKIYEYLARSRQWDEAPIDLAKALTLHSGLYELPANSKINPDLLANLVGFGIPDYGRALDCAESVATFIYTDKLGVEVENGSQATKPMRANKHKVKFTIPQELVGKNKKLRVKGTLVYTPLTSTLGVIDYSLADIEINLHYKNSKGTFQSGQLTSQNSDYRDKWSPVKSFERTFTAYKDGFWEVWLTLNARGKANHKDYEQPYALVISIEDVTPTAGERINLYEIIKNRHKEYVQVMPAVRVQS